MSGQSDRELRLQLSAYLDGDLTAQEQREVEARLAQDATARTLLDDLRRVRDAVRDERVPPVPDDLLARIHRDVKRESRWRFMRPAPLAAAAMLVVALLVGALYETNRLQGDGPPLAARRPQPPPEGQTNYRLTSPSEKKDMAAETPADAAGGASSARAPVAVPPVQSVEVPRSESRDQARNDSIAKAAREVADAAGKTEEFTLTAGGAVRQTERESDAGRPAAAPSQPPPPPLPAVAGNEPVTQVSPEERDALARAKQRDSAASAQKSAAGAVAARAEPQTEGGVVGGVLGGVMSDAPEAAAPRSADDEKLLGPAAQCRNPWPYPRAQPAVVSSTDPDGLRSAILADARRLQAITSLSLGSHGGPLLRVATPIGRWPQVARALTAHGVTGLDPRVRPPEGTGCIVVEIWVDAMPARPER